MNWNEQDHPRDEDGKFTFKNGGRTTSTSHMPREEIANTLFANTRDQEEEKRKKERRKNELLNILGDRATNADILLRTPEELEKRINEEGVGKRKVLDNKPNGLQQKPNDKQEDYSLGDKIQQKVFEFGLNKGYGASYRPSTWFLGEDTMGMIDMAHKEMKNPDYIKDAIELKNYEDPRVASDKNYLVKKLFGQFNNDYTKVTNIDNIKGYFFKNDSEPSKRISQDQDFLKTIKENRENILNGKDISMHFPRYTDNKESNLHFALGHVDIRNGYLDKKGNLRIKVYDTYEFNKENKTLLNQAGRNQMLKGNLIPYFTIHDIIIPKDKVNELWK